MNSNAVIITNHIIVGVVVLAILAGVLMGRIPVETATGQVTTIVGALVIALGMSHVGATVANALGKRAPAPSDNSTDKPAGGQS